MRIRIGKTTFVVPPSVRRGGLERYPEAQVVNGHVLVGYANVGPPRRNAAQCVRCHRSIVGGGDCIAYFKDEVCR